MKDLLTKPVRDVATIQRMVVAVSVIVFWGAEFFIEGEREMKKKRKYFRKCGVCGERHEQSDMIRTACSPNGWICLDCHRAEHPEYDDLGEE